MAATASSSDEQIHLVPLRVLVDKQTNKVLFAEAKKEFVDVLLSFLTLPLGTIARLVAKESNIEAVRVGCLSSLYESVAHLEESLWTPTCKEMLLQPRNSMEAYCQQMRLNIDDTDPTKYLLCEKLDCKTQNGSLLSFFKNQRCRCGDLLKKEETPENLDLENGFVMETATFIICDDLSLMPNVLGTSIDLLLKLGIEDMDAVEERTVDISKREVFDLLKLSLVSKTTLTDFISGKKKNVDNHNQINQSLFDIGDESSNEGRNMVVKLLVRKSNKKVVFAEVKEDFADFLFSLLTFPLGAVLHMLKGSSSLSCIDKLYKSLTELSSDRYLRSQGLKDKLVNPPCAPQFNLINQILPIAEAFLPTYYLRTYNENWELRFVLSTTPQAYRCNYFARLNIVDPKSSIANSSGHGGFIKGPSMYMVTDDLVVSPMSSISGLALNSLKFPISDLEEKVISVGLEEGLGILKACLTSTAALTNGLKPFTKNIKVET